MWKGSELVHSLSSKNLQKVISKVPALLELEQAQMCITERMGFPEVFMGGLKPPPLSTDQSETRWGPCEHWKIPQQALVLRSSC